MEQKLLLISSLDSVTLLWKAEFRTVDQDWATQESLACSSEKKTLLVLKFLILHSVVFSCTHFHYGSSEGHLVLCCAVSHCSPVLISIQLFVMYLITAFLFLPKPLVTILKVFPSIKAGGTHLGSWLQLCPLFLSSINPYCFSLTSNFCWSSII